METKSEMLRCNMCDEMVKMEDVARHLEGRNHAVKKKVAEYNEMNAQVGKRQYENDVSVVNAWIRNLREHDFISKA